MKPAGRERDIEIAKLKGWKPYYAEGIFLDGIRVVDVRGTKQIIDAKTISWSTDRNAAWELWDEIKVDKFYQEAFMDGKIIGCVVMLQIDGEFSCYGQGKDFADCVSQAWITWKEGKK
jgi:hypothetical protein